jgi:acyl-CoA thioester hydrolase
MARFHEQVMGVYFDDLDPFQILHNARYLVLFERTLGSFWETVGLGAFDMAGHTDHLHLVAHNSVDYLSPVRGVGRVRVRVSVEKLGRTSLTFGFTVMPLDRDVEHARGRRVVVRVDPATQAATPWSAEFRARLEPWLAEPA